MLFGLLCFAGKAFGQASGTISLADPTTTLAGCTTAGFTVNVNAFPIGTNTTYPITVEVTFAFASKLVNPSFTAIGWTLVGTNTYSRIITAGSFTGNIIGNYTASSVGDYKYCPQTYSATLRINGVVVGTPQTHTVTLTANNQWTITKTVVGIVNANTVRYRIEMYSPQCNGAYNLYKARLLDNASNGGIFVWSSSSPAYTHTPYGSSTINFNLGTLHVGGTIKTVFVDIKYPCSLPPSTTVCNQARIRATIPLNCTPPPPFAFPNINVLSNNACTTLPLFTGLISPPSASKVLSDGTRNNSPGCQNSYKLTLTNTQQYNINNIVVTDYFPASQLTLIPNMSYSSNFPTYIYNNSSGTLTWTLNSSFVLQPGESIQITIPFQVNGTAAIGSQVCNNAKFTATGFSVISYNLCTNAPINNLPISINVPACCFTVQAIAPRPVIYKSITNGVNHTAGDILHFKVCVSNYGGVGFTGTFSDLIDPAIFNAPTNVQVFMDNAAGSGCSISSANMIDLNSGGTIINFNSGTNQLQGTLNVPGQCQLNLFSNAVIEYDVQVKNDPFPCAYKNTAKLVVNGTNYTASANFNLKISNSLSMLKEISVDGGATYQLAASAAPGQTVKYRIKLTNISPYTLRNLRVIDNLPNGPDNELYATGPTIPRNASGTPKLTTTASGPTYAGITTGITASSYTSLFSPIPGCSQTASAYSTGRKAVYFNYGTNTLAPSQSTTVTFDAKVDVNAPIGGVAINDAFICSEIVVPPQQPETCVNPFLTSAALTPTITNPVSLTIIKFDPPCCKDKQFSAVLQSAETTGDINGTAWKPNLTVSYSGLPVRKFTVSVVDVVISYSNTLCANEFTPFGFLGTLYGTPNTIGGLYINSTQNYTPYSPPNWFIREMMWDIYSGPGTATSFNSGVNVPLFVILPAKKQLTCCTGTAVIKLKFTFEDNNCNVCEFFQDFTVTLPNY